MDGDAEDQNTAQMHGTLDILRRDALAGSAEAAAELFDALRASDDPESREEALRVVEPFAESGDIQSIIRMAKAYNNGIGTERSEIAAISWMKSAADLGSMTAACMLYDIASSSGDPVCRNLACRYLLESRDPDSLCAQLRLMSAHIHGNGTEKDPEKAAEILSRIGELPPNWKKELPWLALELMRQGNGALESAEKSRLDQDDIAAAKYLGERSADRMFLALMETNLRVPASYADFLKNSESPEKQMAKDFQTVIDAMMECGTSGLLSSRNASDTLNGALDAAIEAGLISKDDVSEIFKSIKIDDSRISTIQEGLRAMLKKLDGKCRKFGVNYMIACGTLLGSARHGGFIPWDDDVDIYMMREDYDRLAKALEDDPEMKTKEFVYLSSMGNGINYGHQIRMRDVSPRVLHIDVMIFDGVRSSDDEGWEEYRNYIAGLRAKIDALAKEDLANKVSPVKDPRIIGTYEEAKKNFTKDMGGSEGDAVALTFDNPVPRPRRKLFDRSDFFPVKDIQFEDLVLSGPNNGEKIMEALYGDIMRFPPALLNRKHSDWNDADLEEIKRFLRELEESGD